MGENVGISAGESPAEGASSPSVDHIRAYNRKMQLGGHFQKDFKFVNLWLVLGGSNIELDHSVDIFLTGFYTNTQVGGLPAGRTDTTGLETEFVETAVFGTGFAKPMMGKCLIHPAGEKELAKRAFDTKSFEGFFLFFSASIPQVRSCLLHFTDFPFRLWKCPVENDLGRLIVSIDMRRGQGKLGADSFIPVPEGIFIELARFGWVITNAKQVIDRVLIFLTAEAIVGHGWAGGHPGRLAFT